MSHLRPAPGATAPATGALGLGAPGFAHPLLAPAEWAELARPGAPVHWAVLKAPVTGGPGARPDPYCLAAAARLRDAGVPLLGHLDLRWGARADAEVIPEAGHFLDWYSVAGFYLDRAPAAPDALPRTRGTVAALRGRGQEAGCPVPHLVLGHGTHPHPGYAGLADQLVTFRGTWADYRWSQAAPWTADQPPSRFCHLVYGVPRGHLEEALRIARWQGAGTVFVTDVPGDFGRTSARRGEGPGPGAGTDPFETLPGFWDEIVSRIGIAVSE
ncbi:phage tail protein [Streptomyces sp. JJ66]|uniref:spherulation-specific family 4 protein n=1 Tax=Streptomyces sp. JJ66 TaxID=2803843 RepID=UPI001C59A4B6|nr:spherulation-specific family 4 protein [Streptomyces sp. JJ66]MBW1602977.1 phage tail protein [Streptomyces sp. JJ66]